MELASRFWRAMGFADIGQAKALTEADVLALRRLAGLVEAGLLSEAMAVQVARSTGQTTARLADWQIDSFLEGLTEPPEPGMTRTEVTYPLVELLLPELEEFLVYVWRRQLAAATGRVVQAADDEEMVDRRLAVGFADLVGFTRLTRRMEEEELGELVEAFETTAADLVAAHGGRLIKTLGDEVLYAADDAGVGRRDRAAAHRDHGERRDHARAARRHRLRHGHHPHGRCLRHDGEPRLPAHVDSAQDAVLVDSAFAEELIRSGEAPASEAEAAEAAATAEKEGEEPPTYRFALQPMWQRPVRGLGVVEPWLLAAAPRRARRGVSGRRGRGRSWGRGAPPGGCDRLGTAGTSPGVGRAGVVLARAPPRRCGLVARRVRSHSAHHRGRGGDRGGSARWWRRRWRRSVSVPSVAPVSTGPGWVPLPPCRRPPTPDSGASRTRPSTPAARARPPTASSTLRGRGRRCRPRGARGSGGAMSAGVLPGAARPAPPSWSSSRSLPCGVADARYALLRAVRRELGGMSPERV